MGDRGWAFKMMRRLIDEIRLAVANVLLEWALKLSPKSPDGARFGAALELALRLMAGEPVNVSVGFTASKGHGPRLR